MKKNIFLAVSIITIIAFSGCAESTFFAYASKGDLPKVKQAIAQGASPNSIGYTEHNERRSALHVAAQEGHLDVVKYLVEHGADVNLDAGGNGTPVGVAAFKGHFEIVKYLIQHGADINKKTVGVYTMVMPVLLKYKKLQQQNDINTYIVNDDHRGLKAYTDKNPDTLQYVESKEIALSLIGPSGMTVRDVIDRIKSGEDTDKVISRIEKVKTKYKIFDTGEMALLESMGLDSSVIRALIEKTEKIKEEEEAYKRRMQKIRLEREEAYKRAIEKAKRQKVIEWEEARKRKEGRIGTYGRGDAKDKKSCGPVDVWVPGDKALPDDWKEKCRAKGLIPIELKEVPSAE